MHRNVQQFSLPILSPRTSIHVNAFLPLLSMTHYTLFALTLQMLYLLLTRGLLLNSFDAELLCTETPFRFHVNLKQGVDLLASNLS